MRNLIILSLTIVCTQAAAQDSERKAREARDFWNQFSKQLENPESVAWVDCRRADSLDKVFELLPRFTNLEKLDLWGLGLDSLPDIFEAFPKLKWINVGENNLTEFPPSFSSLTELQVLRMHENKISYLPSNLYQCELTQLYAVNNFLQDTISIPEAWGKLEILALSGNPISTLKGISNLKSVEKLSLSHTCIERLPDEFQSCKKLESLHLYRTPITELPKSVLKRGKLWYILIEDTQIEDETIQQYRLKYRKKTFDTCQTC